MHKLAPVVCRQARLRQGRALFVDAFHAREAKLGPDHPHTLDSLRELVRLYESWPKPDEAAKWRAQLPPESTPPER